MASTEELKKELEQLQNQLTDPDFVLDYKKVAATSKRMAEIQRLMEVTDQDADNDRSEVIVEIRAGAGGDEASLFAVQLFEMYKKYSTLNSWRFELLDYNRTSLGGFKHIIFELAGNGVGQKMSFESGVHRVQRIPETEKSGRVHTSTASVAVLPKAKETDIEIKPDELEISFYRSGGPGGQNVNKVSTAVRILHKPSGLVVSSQE